VVAQLLTRTHLVRIYWNPGCIRGLCQWQVVDQRTRRPYPIADGTCFAERCSHHPHSPSDNWGGRQPDQSYASPSPGDSQASLVPGMRAQGLLERAGSSSVPFCLPHSPLRQPMFMPMQTRNLPMSSVRMKQPTLWALLRLGLGS